MLMLFFVSLTAILIFVGLMAVGVLMGREPIKGSCGGLNKLGFRDEGCPVCGGNPAKCESESPSNDLARDAMKPR
jgi:hypothetical protein